MAAFHKLPPLYDQNNYIGNFYACQLKGKFRRDFLLFLFIFYSLLLLFFNCQGNRRVKVSEKNAQNSNQGNNDNKA